MTRCENCKLLTQLGDDKSLFYLFIKQKFLYKIASLIGFGVIVCVMVTLEIKLFSKSVPANTHQGIQNIKDSKIWCTEKISAFLPIHLLPWLPKQEKVSAYAVLGNYVLRIWEQCKISIPRLRSQFSLKVPCQESVYSRNVFLPLYYPKKSIFELQN